MSLREAASGCCLSLCGVGHGHRAALQEAGEELVSRVHVTALAIRSDGLSHTSGLAPDLEVIDFLDEVGDLAT